MGFLQLKVINTEATAFFPVTRDVYMIKGYNP